MRNRLLPYGVAILSVTVALLLMLLLNPWLAMTQTPFLLFFGAVSVSAWYGGRQAGAIATLVSALLANNFFLSPANQLSLDLVNVSRTLLFTLEGISISFLCGALRSAERRAQVSLQMLQANETRFRRLVESNIIGVVSCNIYGAITEANEEFLRITGFTREDVLAGRVRWDEMTPPDLKHLDVPALEQLMAKGKHTPYEKAFIGKDGRRVPVVVGSALVEDKCENVISFVLDLSERNRAEEALSESAERLNLALIASNMGDWSWDAATDTVTFSSRAAEIFGIPPGPYMTWTRMRDLLHEGDRELARLAVERVIRERSDYDIEYRVLRPDGVQHWVSAKGRAQYDASGQVLGMSGVVQDVTARKQAEEALRESEERFQAFMNHSPASAWIADIEGRLLYLSPTYFRMFQFPQQDAVGKNIIDIYPEEFAQRFLENNQRVFETKQVFDTIETAPRPDGSVGEFLVYKFPMTSSSEEILLGGVAVDITERRWAEEALRESEAKYRRIVETANEGIWMIDAALRTTYVNPRMAQILGYSQEEMLGRSSFEFIFEADRAEAERKLELRRHVVGEQSDFLLRHKNGLPVWVRSNTSPMVDDNGQCVGVLAMVTDISDRKRAEEALRESEIQLQKAAERFELAAAAVNCLIYDWDVQQNTVFRTDGLTRILGYSLQEAEPTGDWWIEQIHPEDWPRVRAEAEAMQANSDRCVLEYRVRNKNNRYVYVLDYGIVVRDADGRVVRVVGSTIDISDRKQAEAERENLLKREQAAREQAEAANRIKDEFLAVLSHELRSPLNPILGWTKLLQTRKFDEQATKRALETIERNAKLQTQLIEDLLDVSRILRGKMVLNVRPVNLVTVVEAALETVRLAAAAKNIQIQTSQATDVESVSGDSARLQQVVWNLLSNAVKFTPSGGRVEVRLERVGNFAQIQVSDNGKGITPEFLPYVFEYFRQEDGQTTRKFGGLGLGLAIVRQLTELHGGTVWAESPGEGLGATFTVQLPLMVANVETRNFASLLPANVETQNFGSLQILVVDDEADMRELAVTILEEYGAVVKVAASATEALMALDRFKPDILISDIGMPDIDGYMLMRQVRQRSPDQGGQIPAIALTAYAGEFNQQQALEAGFQIHIAKPVEPSELAKAIATLVGRSLHV